MTISDCLNLKFSQLSDAGIESARLDAEVIISSILQTQRSALFSQDDRVLSDFDLRLIDSAIARRCRGEPVAYIIAKREFWSIEIETTKAVLIPRPETELICDLALELFPDKGHKLKILDLCTGSGCIAAALAVEYPSASITATDISEDALIVAHRNLKFAADRVKILQGDLFAALQSGSERFDLITANPPYIADCEAPSLAREIIEYEPQIALFGGKEGLDFLRRIIENAPGYLENDGCLLLEHGYDQAAEIQSLAQDNGSYSETRSHRDLAGLDRVISLRRSAN